MCYKVFVPSRLRNKRIDFILFPSIKEGEIMRMNALEISLWLESGESFPFILHGNWSVCYRCADISAIESVEAIAYTTYYWHCMRCRLRAYHNLWRDNNKCKHEIKTQPKVSSDNQLYVHLFWHLQAEHKSYACQHFGH